MRFTIKTKLIIAFSLLTILLFVMGGIMSILNTNALKRVADAQLARNAQLMVAMDFEKHVTESVLTAMDIIIDKGDRKVSAERDSALKANFKHLTDISPPALLNAADTPEEKQAALYLTDAITKLEPVIMNDLYKLVESGAADEMFDAIDDGIDNAAGGDVGPQISAMIASIQEEVEEANEIMRSTQKRSNETNIVMLAIVALVAIGSLILAIRSIIGPVNKMTKITSDLAEGGDGDLTKRINSDSNDEMTVLGDNINKFIDNVHGVVVNVAEQSQSLTSASSELAATTEELSSTFGEQTNQVTEVASAMEEMSASSTEVLNSVESSLITAEEATTKTREG